MRIEIDGKEVDVLEDARLTIVNQWFSFDKYFFLKSPVGSSISLPLTHRNQSALKANTTGGNGSEKNIKSIAVYFWQSLKVFDGSCYVEETSNSYSVYLYGGGKSIKELLGDSKLWNLPGTTRYFSQVMIDDLSDDDNADVKVCLLDNGRYPINFSESFRAIDFFLSFKTKYLIDQIFDNEGYTVNWGFDTTEFEDDYTSSRYPMTHNWASTAVYRLKTGSTEVSTGWTVYGAFSDKYWLMPDPTIMGDYEEPIALGTKVKDFISFEFEKIYNTVDAPNVWLSRAEVSVKISVTLTGTYAGANDAKGLGVYVAVKPQDNEDGSENDAVIKYLLPVTVVGTSFSLSSPELPVDLEAGDRLYMYMIQYVIPSPGTFTFTAINLVLNVNEEGEGFSVDELEDFDDMSTLPNITKVDYLKDVMSNFDLFIDVNTADKIASIYAIRDAKDWSQTSTDISRFIDINSIVLTSKSQLSQTQSFGYKDTILNSFGISDNRLGVKGDGIVISEIPDLTNKVSRLFKNVNMIDVTEGGSIKDSWEYVRFTKGVTEENETLNLEFDVGSSDTIGPKVFSCAKFVNNLGVSTLSSNWHNVRRGIYQDFLMLEATFNFPNGYQSTIKPWITYYINCTSKNKFISGHFLVQKVQFDEAGNTKLELIKLPEILTGTPPAPLAWQWNDEEFVQWNDDENVDLNN